MTSRCTSPIQCLKQRLTIGELSSRKSLTVFGEEVDDGVRLTVAVEVGQLGAAVDGHVVDTQASLADAAGVQHRTLDRNTTRSTRMNV